MKPTHTPGPWELEQVPTQSVGGSNTCYKIGPFNACIYDDWTPRENGISEEENKANAQLIAAAPELLEALDNLLKNYVDGLSDINFMITNMPIVEQAQEAIKKATSMD